MKSKMPPWPDAAGGGETAFGDPLAEAHAALHGTIAVPLSHEGVIEVGGADAATFLQGQLSNDVRRVTGRQAQLSSFNSAKGRMLAVVGLLLGSEGYELWLERSVLELVLRRLRLYVLRSRVTLTDGATRHAALGLAGVEADAALRQLGLPVPEAAYEVAARDGVRVLRRAGARPRYSVHAESPHVAELWADLPSAVEPAGTQAWRLCEIEAGMPVVHPATQDRFVPQMCNLDRLGGISFDKGCYTGQEVVARVHYLGAVKRRMRSVRLTEPPPPPGARIDAGEVVQAALHPEGGSLALVVGAE